MHACRSMRLRCSATSAHLVMQRPYTLSYAEAIIVLLVVLSCLAPNCTVCTFPRCIPYDMHKRMDWSLSSPVVYWPLEHLQSTYSSGLLSSLKSMPHAMDNVKGSLETPTGVEPLKLRCKAPAPCIGGMHLTGNKTACRTSCGIYAQAAKAGRMVIMNSAAPMLTAFGP